MGLHRYLQAAKDVVLQHGGPLRLAWIDRRYTGAGRLALSPLPGLTLYQRSLRADLQTLQRQSVDHVLCLLEDQEFARWGVADLLGSYHDAGFVVRRFPIRDHSVCTPAGMRETVNWLSETLAGGATVIVHCVGGLGRSGIVAACYLVAAGLNAEEAIAEVRHTRSPFAIETAEQAEFVRLFANEPVSQAFAAV
jgi:protein-tyrosine phosphatase